MFLNYKYSPEKVCRYKSPQPCWDEGGASAGESSFTGWSSYIFWRLFRLRYARLNGSSNLNVDQWLLQGPLIVFHTDCPIVLYRTKIRAQLFTFVKSWTARMCSLGSRTSWQRCTFVIEVAHRGRSTRPLPHKQVCTDVLTHRNDNWQMNSIHTVTACS